MDEHNHLTLDNLYGMVAHIYNDRNSVRSKEATFAHFVEVCGMLTVHARNKKRESFNMTDALYKSLGWHFPLLAKLRIRSVEQLVFRKYPKVCPYCRLSPHEERVCKQVQGTEKTVDHIALMKKYRDHWDVRPKGLDEWQSMFNDIYPRGVSDITRSALGLMEELGELAEAIRVYDVHPHYFVGEAADIFSYIMGLANEFTIREAQDGRQFSFEREFLGRYPGLCSQCGSRICICPAVPSATIGRMAKELHIETEENLFISDLALFSREGEKSAQITLEGMGGYAGLTEKLPFDRGDANHGLLQLCLKIAAIVEEANSGLASSLRAEALKLGEVVRDPGTPATTLPISALITQLREIWKSLEEEDRNRIKQSGGMAGEIGEIFDTIRVLFVYSNPDTDDGPLKLRIEQREIRNVIRYGSFGNKIITEELQAATSEDFRRALLHNEFDIIHFSGHANKDGLIFEDNNQRPNLVQMPAIRTALLQYPTIKCIILNACESIKALESSLCPVTIGMDDSVADDCAIAFSRSFYDALAGGKTLERAFSEGISAVGLAGYDSNFIRMLRNDSA